MIIEALFAGKPQPFGPRQQPSSIIKQAYERLQIDANGAIEDEQGNKKLHGGPEMALHQYSQHSYQVLRSNFPKLAERLTIGSIGENISSPNMTDENVFIGDVYQIGDVVLQVNSPRMPCTKINHRFDAHNMDIFIADNGLTGWYYRVLETGTLELGQTFELIHRVQQTLSVKDLMSVLRGKDRAAKQKAANISGLAKEWVRKLQK